MNRIQLSVIGIAFIDGFAISSIQCAWGQKPAIKSVDKLKGQMEEWLL
jgi:hypothetical protein